MFLALKLITKLRKTLFVTKQKFLSEYMIIRNVKETKRD